MSEKENKPYFTKKEYLTLSAGKSEWQKFVINFFAGGTSASVAVTLTAPLERIKLVLQIQDYSRIPKCDQYTGITNCFVRLFKEEGIRGLWRGNWASVLRCFPSQALNFSVKDMFRAEWIKRIGTEKFEKRLLGNLLSGGLAGCASLAVIYPLEYARTRLALDVLVKGNCQFTGLKDCLRKTIEAEGPRGLYRGFVNGIWGVFVYRAVYFGIYDTIIEMLPEEYRYHFWTQFTVAEFAAVTGGLVSYPFDTVRRCMMLQSLRGEGFGERYKKSLMCYKAIYREHGMRGFFKGAWSNVIRGISAASMLIFYDDIQFAILRERSHYASVMNHKDSNPIFKFFGWEATLFDENQVPSRAPDEKLKDVEKVDITPPKELSNQEEEDHENSTNKKRCFRILGREHFCSNF